VFHFKIALNKIALNKIDAHMRPYRYGSF